MHLIEYIKKIDFFKNLNEEEMKLLCSISTMSKYENNSILFYENDVRNSLLFLVEGLLKIYKFDKFPQTNDTVQACATELPLEDNSINCLMFDPPFLATTGKSLKVENESK